MNPYHVRAVATFNDGSKGDILIGITDFWTRQQKARGASGSGAKIYCQAPPNIYNI